MGLEGTNLLEELGIESLSLIFEGQFDKTFIPVTLQFATQNYYKDIDIHKIFFLTLRLLQWSLLGSRRMQLYTEHW